MPDYRCQSIRALARQLAFSPPGQRRAQVDRAESLYWEVDPEGSYPIEYLAYRITGLRAEPDDIDAESEAILFGAAVRLDLLALVTELSGTLADGPDAFDPPPLTTQQVAAELGVTTRTVARYRSQGLFARQLVGPHGRGRVYFLPASVQRFVASRPGRADEAARFARMDEPTRHAIVIRARRIRSRTDASAFGIAQHLARKYGRSVETIRQCLVHHDQRDPRFAIFRDRTPPLTEKQQRVIHRAYGRGVPVRKLRERYGKGRDAIYRVINLQRARALAARDLGYIASPTFDRDDAEEVILGGAWPLESAGVVGRVPAEPAEFAPLHAEQEQAMFVRYNYLKHRAAKIVAGLDRYHPAATRLSEAERYVAAAEALRRHLMDIYRPLVRAVAAQHRNDQSITAPASPERLTAVGESVLGDMIWQFDATRGPRFATALTWALMRHYAAEARPRRVRRARV